jgi:hypothetical protein
MPVFIFTTQPLHKNKPQRHSKIPTTKVLSKTATTTAKQVQSKTTTAKQEQSKTTTTK